MNKFYLLFSFFSVLIILIILIIYGFYPKTASILVDEDIEDIIEEEILVEEDTYIFNHLDLDFKTDNSITKFVSPDVPFNDKKYIPYDLVNISWKNIIDRRWTQTLRKEALEYLNLLSDSFYEEFNQKLDIISAYRSYEYQAWIKARWCSDYFCAKAWYSEHQSGLAIDFFEATDKKTFLSNNNYKKYYEWLKDNAHKYWFHNTYRRGRDIDWYEIEPWHWRFVWVEFASYLYEKNLTFAEFIKENNILAPN